MSTAFPLDTLSYPQQRALIDLVCSREFSRDGSTWRGRYTHRGPTVEALIGRELARREGTDKVMPTAGGVALVGAEARAFNAIVAGESI